MRSAAVVEVLALAKLALEIDVALLRKELRSLLAVSVMGSLVFTVQLRRPPFDTGMLDPLIFGVALELGLELVAVIRLGLCDSERELFDDMNDKLEAAGLLFINL